MGIHRRLFLVGVGGAFVIWGGMAVGIWALRPPVWRSGWVELLGAGASFALAFRMGAMAKAAGTPFAGWSAAIGLWTGLAFALTNRRLTSMARGTAYPAEWAAQDAVVPLVCGTVTLIVTLAADCLLRGRE